jgi:hypothetical protein
MGRAYHSRIMLVLNILTLAQHHVRRHAHDALKMAIQCGDVHQIRWSIPIIDLKNRRTFTLFTNY